MAVRSLFFFVLSSDLHMMSWRIFHSVLISLGLHAFILFALVNTDDTSPVPSHAPFQVGLEREAVHGFSVRKKATPRIYAAAPVSSAASAVSSSAPPGNSPPSPTGALKVSGQSEYLSQLSKWIEARKVYPLTARRLGQEGQVEIGFTITRDGEIREARLTQVCRYGSLNEAALALARGLGRFKPLPEGMGMLEWKLHLPINYRLQK